MYLQAFVVHLFRYLYLLKIILNIDLLFFVSNVGLRNRYFMLFTYYKFILKYIYPDNISMICGFSKVQNSHLMLF